MFKVIAAPIQVIVYACKAMVTAMMGINNLAEGFEAATSVAKDAAQTWAEEEKAVNQAKFQDLQKRIKESQEAGVPFKRKDEDEIQL